MTVHDLLTAIFGAKGPVIVAGALGGLVRWLTLRSHPVDGIIAIIVGAIAAGYLGPLAEPAMDAMLGNVILDEASRASFGGFIIGLGGVSVTGFVLDFWRAKRGDKKDSDE